MSNPDVHAYKQRLDELFDSANRLPEEPSSVKAHWARYLCVVTSGFVETSVRAVYEEYARGKSHANVAAFVAVSLERLQNPKMEKILEVTRSFSADWEDELRRATEGALKDAVDTIVANRNQLAHGRDVGITVARMKDCYAAARAVIDLIEAQCSD